MGEEVTFKTDCAYFSRLCPLKCVILFKKQYFRTFENSNIINENKAGNENPVLSCAKQTFKNLSKILD